MTTARDEPPSGHGRARIARIALGDVIHRAARRFGDRTAVIDGERRTSFREIDRASNRFAHHLIGRGLQRGAHVGMLCDNSTEMIAAFVGIQKAAMVWVPINTGLDDAAIGYILGHAEVSVVVIDAKQHARAGIREAIARQGASRVVVGDPAVADAGRDPIGWLSAIEGQADTLPDVEIAGDDLAQIMYTSGTTGRQKGVMHSHASVQAALMSNVAEFGATSNDVASGMFPLFHVSQHTVAMTFWIAGAAISLSRGFDAETLMRDIERVRITFVVALPMMYAALLDHPARARYDLSSLRLCIYAMAPMAQPLLTRLIEGLCPDFALCSGQTEMYSITTMFKPEEQLRRFGSYWGSSAYVNETAIMDDDGRLLDRGCVGEIVHRGANVMLGYYKDPDATRAAQAFGWHHTGDLGMFDADGQLLFVDRKKDMIKTGGENVASMKVEEVLLRHAAIANAAAVGLPHPRWGEAVTAFVLLKPGVAVVPEDLDAHCRALLGRHEVPKRVFVVDAFPMTSTGKIQKAWFRKHYEHTYAP